MVAVLVMMVSFGASASASFSGSTKIPMPGDAYGGVSYLHVSDKGGSTITATYEFAKYWSGYATVYVQRWDGSSWYNVESQRRYGYGPYSDNGANKKNAQFEFTGYANKGKPIRMKVVYETAHGYSKIWTK